MRFKENIFWFLLITLVSCDFFRLREPEFPIQNEGWVYPNTPENVIENFQLGLQLVNLEIYLSCFKRDSFLYYPEERLINGPNGHLYRDWNFERESTYVSVLFREVDLGHRPFPIFALLDIVSQDTLENRVRLKIRYEIHFYLIRNPRYLTARGELVFYMKESPVDYWWVYECFDTADSNYLSFAEVKALDF